MKTFPSSRRRGGTGPIWLDLLSDDVCERIAAHLCSRTQTQSALRLAETSDKQCAAVVASLDYLFEIPAGCTLDDARRWANVFMPDVRNCNIYDLALEPNSGEELNHDTFLVRAEAAILPLLHAPKLYHATIPCETRFLEAIAVSKSVRELRLNIEFQPPMQKLLHTLSALQLT